MISIFAVVRDVQDDSQWWSKLNPSPIVTFKSYFPKQARHVTNGRPLLYCNGEVHMMQIVVSYANHFTELVEIFPSSNVKKCQSANIERQFIYAYDERNLRYYPTDDRQPKV